MDWIKWTGPLILAGLTVITLLYKVGQVGGFIKELKDNHLPHIYEELRYLRKRIDKEEL